MTRLTVALIVADADKAAVEAAIAALTPDYTVGFLRPCCALGESSPTWETPPSHWYANATGVDAAHVAAWQEAVDAAGPGDALRGLVLFTAQNADDPVGWAQSNLESQGLRFVPDPE
jgi:hypothetical protein